MKLVYDLKLTNSGDLEISEDGDVSLTQSVRQAVLIRLRWLFGEWRPLLPEDHGEEPGHPPDQTNHPR